ncbi:MAG: hypothetical protein HYZ25_19965 [Chloroflexi bacterium]|nr:hypothetical protein [Chloroflexota bacterium]
MRTIVFFVLLALFLTGCGTWNVAPQPFPVWTPIPSRTPSIFTPTPVVLIPSLTATSTAAISTVTPVSPPTDTPTFVPSLPPITDTASLTFTPVPVAAMQIEIIGCNTGFDFTHGMGEVTNAYVTLKNTGTVDLPNACGLLRAADEDREHPDKKACVPNLPVNYRVTLKLTVDSAYKQDTIIQVDGLSNDVVLLRIDKQSCTSLDVLGIGVPGDIGVVKPITP